MGPFTLLLIYYSLIKMSFEQMNSGFRKKKKKKEGLMWVLAHFLFFYYSQSVQSGSLGKDHSIKTTEIKQQSEVEPTERGHRKSHKFVGRGEQINKQSWMVKYGRS